MPRLRPNPNEPVVDGAKLRADLAAVAGSPGDDASRRAAALALLKAALAEGRRIARERLEAGARGMETARLLAAVADEALTALYEFATVHVLPARKPERLALIAVGGYGRGALAPHSDIDLLFLRPSKATARAEAVIEFMLYALWDLGFKVGHASRTVDECLRFAKEDFTIRTALLEARRLAGDETLATDLKRRFRKEVVEGTAAEFVAAKLAERDQRHERAGASRYMVEPNVKEGKGGLRDLNTLFWIAQYLHPPERPSEIVPLKEFDRREVKAFLRASDFLWATRSFLHFTTGRAEERLTFELQPTIAKLMGYGDFAEDGEAPVSVERFMRRYFLIAREVGALTRAFCAKLEAEEAKKPQGLSRFLPVRAVKRRPLEAGFHEEAGRLSIDAKVIEQDPATLIRLFRIADSRNLDLHPDAFTAVSRSLNLIGARLRRDPQAARAFLDVLARGRQTERTLRLMNEFGVLGRYIPEFGRIVGQMQYNMYHAYTTDEHTIRAVGVVADIAAGRLADEHPLAVSIMPLVADPEALFLAILLHDCGKGGAPGGQALAGARNARQVCERLGLSEERIELVAWLVQHHLVMSDFAQKRDLSDPRTIAAFAGVVQTPERLRLLTVLTAADIRAVGPGVWNGWKGQLLRELYRATETLFRGGRGTDGAVEPLHDERRTLAETARSTFAAAAPADEQELALAWARSMENAYFAAFPSGEYGRHFALVQRARREGSAAATTASPDGYATQVVVAAFDRPRLFADLCGIMASVGANIVGARVYTSTAGGALDIFRVQDHAGQPFGRDDPRALDRLARTLEAAAKDPAMRIPARPLALGRSAAFRVPPVVVVDNEASDGATVLEVSGRDRPGLLQALARALADGGLSVHSAHIENYGERAVDAFYVVDGENGSKLGDPDRIAALKRALTDVLLEVEPEAEKAREKVRARAALAG